MLKLQLPVHLDGALRSALFVEMEGGGWWGVFIRIIDLCEGRKKEAGHFFA